MPVQAKQLNFRDVSSDFDEFFNQNKNNLLSLLDQFIDISEFIPFSFYKKYYSLLGTYRDFSLESILSAFILKNILSIPTIDLLISLLHISSQLRSYCGFLKIPNKSQFSRFKSNFLDDLKDLFHNLVDITEDLAKEVNPFLSSIWDSLKWKSLYRLRTIVERSISQIKNFIQIKSIKVRNTVSLKSDIFLACISQLIAFVLMVRSSEDHSNPLAIKSLIA